MKTQHMLAKEFKKLPEGLLWFYMQPKIDGVRALVYPNGDAVSRNGKPIILGDRLVAEVREMYKLTAFKKQYDALDCEITSSTGADFNTVSGIVRLKDPTAPEKHSLKLVVFDMLPRTAREIGYGERLATALALIEGSFVQSIEPVSFVLGRREQDCYDYLKTMEEAGFEGAMIKSPLGLYEFGKRSNNVLKLKSMHDTEFKIVGYQEGKGKLAGAVGALVCVTDTGEIFTVKLAWPESELRSLWANPFVLVGKYVTVKYQSLSETTGIPRFPIGLRIKDDA
jgi:DNA ligase-1